MEDFAVVVCDINGLKAINDSMGHKAGDELIRTACRLICELFKHSPVFRVGGDEFIVLLQDEDYDERYQLMEAINKQMQERCTVPGGSAAVGLRDYVAGEDKTVLDVFQKADSLMYQHKSAQKATAPNE